jgi:hypothetical protein
VATEGDTVAASVTLTPVATDEFEAVRVVVVEVVPELLDFEPPPHPNIMRSAQSATDSGAIEPAGSLDFDGVWARAKRALVEAEIGTESGLFVMVSSIFAKSEVDAEGSAALASCV